MRFVLRISCFHLNATISGIHLLAQLSIPKFPSCIKLSELKINEKRRHFWKKELIILWLYSTKNPFWQWRRQLGEKHSIWFIKRLQKPSHFPQEIHLFFIFLYYKTTWICHSRFEHELNVQNL